VGVGSALEVEEAAREEPYPLPDCEFADATDDATIAVDGVGVAMFTGELEGDDGTADDGVAEDGVAEDGVAEDGVAEDGVAEDGVAEDGVAEDGVAEDGVAEDGVAED
jgi:hypothetical protein